MQNKYSPAIRLKLSPQKIVSYAGCAAGAIGLVCLLVLLLFPDQFVNRFIKPRISRAFTEAYPAYSIHIAGMNYSFLKNRFGFDSVVLSASDGKFSGNIGPFSMSGISWLHLLWGGSIRPENFAGAVVDAQDIVLNFLQSQYEMRCRLLRVSVPDSEIVVDSLKLHPVGDDEQSFAGSKFRKTRFRLVVPHANAGGFACLNLLQGKMCRTRIVQIHDAFLDVLVNKDKPGSKATSITLMPNEILFALKEILQIDSLSIINGRLNYGERFAVGAEPALITFDSMQVLAKGITKPDGSGAASVIQAQANFMKAGMLNVFMSIPSASPVFSFQYSGSVSRMDLSALNSFLETAEQIRITTGVLQEATFKINVVSGCASGKVRAVYEDLNFAVIDKYTGSAKGFSDGIASFMANTFKIRGTNVPDKSDSLKIGEVNYMRKRDDPFFGFVWFALRSGVGDVIGF